MLRVLVPVLLIVVWQAAISLNFTSQATLPSPETVLKAYHELWSEGSLQAALPISLERAGIGLLIGATIGLVLGVFAGLWRIGEEIFDAPLQMLRTIPFIALVPLFITWFGIDEKPKIILIATATVFPMYLNTYHGVRSVDVKLIEAGQVFGLSGLRLAWRVILPSALPGALTGLRYATGVALLALVLAEQINSSAGIGYLIETANQNQRPDIVIAGILDLRRARHHRRHHHAARRALRPSLEAPCRNRLTPSPPQAAPSWTSPRWPPTPRRRLTNSWCRSAAAPGLRTRAVLDGIDLSLRAGSSSPCSGRPAPGRRHCCASWPAWIPPTGDRYWCRAVRSVVFQEPRLVLATGCGATSCSGARRASKARSRASRR